MDRAVDLLHGWIARTADADAHAWLDEKREQIAGGAPDRVLFTSFSAAPRHTGKADLELAEEDLREADAVRPGWRPAPWSVDQAARTLLVLAPSHGEAGAYAQKLERLFSAADVGEAVALYQALPLLPHPEQFVRRAAEGVRSNMTSVLNAVALHNPYPAEHFDETAWNQMVLKAVFVGSSLHRIQGLDERSNPKLARMLVDYAHERWAAGRPVTPDLWRPVGPFAQDTSGLADLETVLREGTGEEQQAAALALAQSPSPRAREILAERPDLREAVEEGRLTWPSADPLAQPSAGA